MNSRAAFGAVLCIVFVIMAGCASPESIEGQLRANNLKYLCFSSNTDKARILATNAAMLHAIQPRHGYYSSDTYMNYARMFSLAKNSGDDCAAAVLYQKAVYWWIVDQEDTSAKTSDMSARLAQLTPQSMKEWIEERDTKALQLIMSGPFVSQITNRVEEITPELLDSMVDEWAGGRRATGRTEGRDREK